MSGLRQILRSGLHHGSAQSRTPDVEQDDDSFWAGLTPLLIASTLVVVSVIGAYIARKYLRVDISLGASGAEYRVPWPAAPVEEVKDGGQQG